ncbi:unnamed protein product [Sphagnum tenellum]
MMSPVWINRGEPYWPLKVAEIEKKKNATYIGDFCLSDGTSWSEQAYAVFFNETPANPSYSQYFALGVRDRYVFITDGASVTQGHWNGIVADDGEIIYSRFRHDFRESTDGSVIVDGGRDYFKCMGHVHNPHVRLTVVRDRIIVNDSLILPYERPKIVK